MLLLLSWPLATNDGHERNMLLLQVWQNLPNLCQSLRLHPNPNLLLKNAPKAPQSTPTFAQTLSLN